MMTKFEINSNGVLTQSNKAITDVVWIDIVNPTKDEHHAILEAIQVDLPLHHEMMQLEYSSRYYEHQGNLYLSANVITKVSPLPESHTISFIATEKQLITMRFSDPNPIQNFIQEIEKHPRKPQDHIDIMIFLLDTLLGRVADIFELFEERTELMSLGFRGTQRTQKRIQKSNPLNKALHEIIDLENVLSKCYQSLASLQLCLGFYQQGHEKLFGDHIESRMQTLKQDIKTMREHGDFLTQKLEFQLDATLGLINIEQTQIIKTFTVLAMIFMPPTLVASIYGMNFHFMPELKLEWGYPLAIVVMIITGLLPYRFFKRKGWL